jgi:Rrf2 family protein
MRLALTKQADYAVRAVLALAGVRDGRRLSVRRLALEEQIPAAFLPRVMGGLVAHGIVEATPGRTGGYRLARPAEDVSLLDIIVAIEGDVRRRDRILRGGPCRPTGACAVHPVFASAHEDLLGRLAGTSVADVAG